MRRLGAQMSLEALTEAERRLLAAVAGGTVWKPEGDRRLDAALIRTLALRLPGPGMDAPWPVHSKGIQIDAAEITGSLDFQSATADVPLWLFDCTIDSPLMFRDARLTLLALRGSHIRSLDLHRARIEAALLLSQSQSRPFKCKGPIDVSQAHIGAELSLLGAEIGGEGPVALDANGARIGSSLVLRKLRSHGLLDLTRIAIEGNLHAQGATLDHPGTDKIVLIARGASVGGDVFLRQGITALGGIDLTRIDVKGGVLCDGAALDTAGGTALSLNQARVGAALQLSQATEEDRRHAKLRGHLDLRGAVVNELRDDGSMWPDGRTGNLKLDGFVYARIGGRTSVSDARSRVRWMKLQRKKDLRQDFKAQPWEQLIKTLKAMGHDNDARAIAIAKARALHRSGTLSWRQWLWSWFSGVTLGYGYEPMRAVWLSVLVWLIGWAVFSSAVRQGIMAPSEATALTSMAYVERRELPPDYPSLLPGLYSLDVFLPVVDLHQERFWLPTRKPNPSQTAILAPPKLGTDTQLADILAYSNAHLDAVLTQERIETWHTLQIILGWILTSLAILGFTGLLRQSEA